MEGESDLRTALDETLEAFRSALDAQDTDLHSSEVGLVRSVGSGVARVQGLPTAQSEELIRFEKGLFGLAFNLDPEEVGVILLGGSETIYAGSEAYRTGRVLDVPVGEGLLGRVVDALGRPLDQQGPVQAVLRWPIERESPPIMHRSPVAVPLQTGIKAIDALIPIGRGQRELILGDRQSGKTAITLDTVINQADTGVICIYCAIAQRASATAKFIADLKEANALRYTVVVATSAEDAPGLKFIAPYAATTIGEFFMAQGKDVLVIYDDLTRHARAYREVSLLLRRPPGREAYPGDVFYIHSRLLERATHLKDEFGGGSLTALPIAETEAQNVAAYIPTNLISITDGQVYLSPDLYQKGLLPAVDVGKSVSRVGGKAQIPAYRDVASDLRLSYTQFSELEEFSRFSTRLDEKTRAILERGRRIREVLKQPQYSPIPVPEQIAILLAATSGALDSVPVEKIVEVEPSIRGQVTAKLGDLCTRIKQRSPLTEIDRKAITDVANAAVFDFGAVSIHGDS